MQLELDEWVYIMLTWGTWLGLGYTRNINSGHAKIVTTSEAKSKTWGS